MCMQDPISDMITRIRNGQSSHKKTVQVSSSRQKEAILNVLSSEGYILGYSTEGDKKKIATIQLKFYEDKPVISKIQRMSKPGFRVYKSSNDLADLSSRDLDTLIVSTSAGVMTAVQAKKINLGGEVLIKLK